MVENEMILSDFEAEPYPGRPLLRAFYHLGIAGEDLRERLGRKDFTGFPEVHYYLGRDIRVREAPLKGRLENGETYSFSLDAPGISGAVLLNGGQWHDLEKVGESQYTAEIRPGSGVLKLSVQFPEKRDEYWPLLIYSVN